MKITVKESMMVKPMEETPCGSMWLSSLDLVFPATYHSRWVNFYPSNAADNFFDAAVLKAALSRALIEFYPYAGRLRKDDNGRIEINCNCEGVLFVEAECDGTVADLGGFSPRPDVTLVPKIDYSNGIFSFPLFLMQLTRFKCGGVCLGFANEHHVSDAISALHFVNSWSEIARGLTTAAAVPPCLDRRILSAQDPPRPRFPHIEHQSPPSLKSPLHHDPDTTSSTFRLSRDQIHALRHKCNIPSNNNKSNYTTYEVVAGHVWRCVSMARGLHRDQEIAASASRGVFRERDLLHEAIDRMDDEYLRSALDYVELNLPNNTDGVVRSTNSVKCPNFGITSWVGMPSYESDFGWGKPVYAGPGVATPEGKSFLFVDPQNEGGLLLSITLHKQHMKRFQKLIYHNSCLISKI